METDDKADLETRTFSARCPLCGAAIGVSVSVEKDIELRDSISITVAISSNLSHKKRCKDWDECGIEDAIRAAAQRGGETTPTVWQKGPRAGERVTSAECLEIIEGYVLAMVKASKRYRAK